MIEEPRVAELENWCSWVLGDKVILELKYPNLWWGGS